MMGGIEVMNLAKLYFFVKNKKNSNIKGLYAAGQSMGVFGSNRLVLL